MMKLHEFLFGSLRRQLILGVAATIAVLMTLFVWDTTERQQALLLERQTQRAEALAQTLATSAAGWLAARDVAGLQELAEAQRADPQLEFAMLLDQKGQVLAHTDRTLLGQYVQDLPREVRPALLARNESLVDAIAPAALGGHTVGWVRVGINQQEARKNLNAITRNGVLYALAAIAIGSILALLMGNRLTRKLYAIRRVSETVRVGRQEVRVPDLGGDEAGQLARDFNAMLDDLHDTQEKLRSIFEGSNDAIMLLTENGFIDCNARTLEMFGLQDKTEFIGHNPAEFSPPVQPDGRASMVAATDIIAKALQSGKNQFEWVHRRKNGEDFPVEVLLSAFSYGGERILQAAVRDITERNAAQEQIEFLAYHDALTKLPNRLLARDHFEQAVLAAEREKAMVALLFIDLDKFKTINDSLGHVIGDGLLKGVAVRLRECLRDIDTLSRQGGDEFLIVLNNVRDTESITVVVEKMLARLAEPFEIDHHELSISLSIGIAVYPDDGKDFGTLLKQSDTAMYQAKESGRNTYRFHTEQMNVDAVEHLRMRNGLRRALEHGEFILHYQPQISLATGAVIGAEALIRWHHPELGMVPPGRFISIAEDSGLIVPIGEWVLREACRQSVAWRKAGLPELLIAVNLSAVQFKRGDVEKSVTRALAESGLNPVLLELELTESILIKDTEKVLATVRRLKSLGVKLSIDDFGTGYSSLSYLKRFNVDKLKIDQSFVRDMADDPNDAAIVSAIIQMAKSLNLTTIAEGVEDGRQLALLRLQHCDEAQGYHFARPMPAAEFENFMLEHQV